MGHGEGNLFRIDAITTYPSVSLVHYAKVMMVMHDGDDVCFGIFHPSDECEYVGLVYTSFFEFLPEEGSAFLHVYAKYVPC